MDTEREGEGGSDGAKMTRSSFERVTLEARKRDDAEVMDDVCCFSFFLRGGGVWQAKKHQVTSDIFSDIEDLED